MRHQRKSIDFRRRLVIVNVGADTVKQSADDDGTETINSYRRYRFDIRRRWNYSVSKKLIVNGATRAPEFTALGRFFHRPLIVPLIQQPPPGGFVIIKSRPARARLETSRTPPSSGLGVPWVCV